MAFSAARGVTQVMNRCEDAKTTGYLDLSGCELMYIADAIYLVLKDYQENIDKCSLKNNKLKKFPKKLIERFPNMAVLNVEGNQINEVPEEIGQWSGLKGINLAKNNLSEFPSQILSVKQLALLDLSYNTIQDIDAETICKSLTSLKQIHLTGNPLASDIDKRTKVENVLKTKKIVAKF
ncbi:leucine rich repeat domain-containing protein [Ditylenchus destructor]|nr:leucine rich repeat domain-containing protein [Ditylenchus destructor]